MGGSTPPEDARFARVAERFKRPPYKWEYVGSSPTPGTRIPAGRESGSIAGVLLVEIGVKDLRCGIQLRRLI